ncbi:hypothetical protein NURINAE_00646 [Candidatus Nitrosacidococcus sp. I8]|nr:hypothetical protein NURINAE_00646 [Candidatus Nitrosacidococcus sp. I8]
MEEPISTYSIPLKFRKLENLHILFWLFKDISWCLIWKPLGIAMIFPTLIAAIIITLHTRNIFAELCHNLAVIFWISANSYWMVIEFLEIDDSIIAYSITYKYLAVIPFSLGIFILLYYYSWYSLKNRINPSP